jgi:hypothetical protein
MSIGELIRALIVGFIIVTSAMLVVRVAVTRYKFRRSQVQFKKAIAALEQEAKVVISI